MKLRWIGNFLATTGFCALVLSHSALAAEPAISADQVIQKADDARAPQGAFSFVVTVKDLKNGAVAEAKSYKVFTKGFDLSLVDTLAPARDKGRKLLMNGYDLWLYLPSIKRATRVGFQQKLTGEVSNGDLARTNFAHDYKGELMGTELVNKKNCYKLDLIQKRKEVTYNRVVYWVEKGTFYPVKADFYALSGKLLKSAEYSDVQNVLGKNRVTAMLIRDALQPTRQSQLKYSNYRQESLDDSFFNKESLSDSE